MPRVEGGVGSARDQRHRVADLHGSIADLKGTGPRFRNEMEVGPGGRQVQIGDPDGNPIELFEPARDAVPR